MAKPKKLTVKIIRELREDYARDMNKIGTIKMARQKKVAEDDFKRSVGEKNWKAFTTQTPRPNCNCGDDEGSDICDPEGMEKLRKAGGVIVEEL